MTRLGDQGGVSEATADRAEERGGARPLFDISGIDLSRAMHGRDVIEARNPHRGVMVFMDEVVWHSEDLSRGIARKRVRGDEFWVAGHFPGKPIYPGVFQVEAAAQLACFLFISRKDRPSRAAFLRIEEVAFRSMVVPGDDLLLLCQDVKAGRRKFVCDVQGLVQNRVTFEGRLCGMMID